MDQLNSFSKIFASLILAIFIQVSCTTEDISPTIELSSNSTSLSEAEGILTISATLNTVVSAPVTIPLVISGDATATSDYTISASEIVIAAGNDAGSITVTGVQDQEIEGFENITFSLSGMSEFLVLSNTSVEVSVLDDDADTDSDGVLDANDICPNTAGNAANNGCPFLGFIINEVHYDPISGIAGDANGDGTRDPIQDEFIEFINHSNTALDVSGYKIYDHIIATDARRVRHTIPSNTILPALGVLVVFGGEEPTGTFGSATIITDTGTAGLSMHNSGEIIEIEDASGNLILSFNSDALSGNPDESYSRNPDITGEFEQHAGISIANGALFSPGTKVDGTTF